MSLLSQATEISWICVRKTIKAFNSLIAFYHDVLTLILSGFDIIDTPMKKILIDANPIVPYFVLGKNSGIGRTCIELICELNRQRDGLPFEIELFTQNMKGVSAKKLNTGFKTHHVYLRFTQAMSTLVRRLRLRELLSGYDLQHITHNYENVVDPSRCIVTIHDAMFFSYPESFLGAEWNRKIIPPFARQVAHIITISENSKREIMEYMDVKEDKISVIPWGIDRSLLYPHKVSENQWTGKKPYFTSVSCDKGRKNTITLLKAYDRFALNDPEHHLILVWRNPTDEAFAITQKAHLKGRVHFASNLPNEELADIYAGATASFFPSLYEGFGLPIVESMACGVPCVTARNSSLEEVGGEAAIYTDPMDIEAIAAEMEKFENGRYDSAQLRRLSLAQADKFSWEKCAAQTIDVYRKCLGV